MSDVITLARTARERLSAALNTLQAPGVPPAVMAVAEPVALAMSLLHKVEAAPDNAPTAAPEALKAVRLALAGLQDAGGSHPSVDLATEAVAGSLGAVHSLSQSASPQQPARVVAPAPAPKPAKPSQAPRPRVSQPPAATRSVPPGGANPSFSVPRPAGARSAAPSGIPRPSRQSSAPNSPVAPGSPGLGSPKLPGLARTAQAPQTAPQPEAAQNVQAAQAAQVAQNAQVARAAQVAQNAQAAQAAQAAQNAQAAQAAQVAQNAQAMAHAQAAPADLSAPVPQQATGTLKVEAALGAHSTTNFYKGLSGNDVVDSGGIFVATYNIPAIGQPLQLTVSMPGGYEFEAKGIVRWCRDAAPSSVPVPDAPPGFGAQFTELTQEARQLVYRYVRNREPLFHDDL